MRVKIAPGRVHHARSNTIERTDFTRPTTKKAAMMNVMVAQPGRGRLAGSGTLDYLKDWIFIVGVVLLTMEAWGDITGARGNNASIERRGIVYTVSILAWASIVNFFEWRRGLVDVGISDAGSWVLAPVGLIVLIAMSVAVFSDELKRWKYAGVIALWIVCVAAYTAVVYSSG